MYNRVDQSTHKIPGAWNFDVEENKNIPSKIEASTNPPAISRITHDQRKINAERKNKEIVIKRSSEGDEVTTYGKLRDNRNFRWIGEQQWGAPILPKAFNTRLKLFRHTPQPIEFEQLQKNESDINLKGSLSNYEINQLGEMLELKTLELSNVNFIGGIDTKILASLCKLHYLNINGSRNLELSDNMAGLVDMVGLRILGLRRAEFMNHNNGAAYASLAQMKSLKHLNIDRTITSEKAPGTSEIKINNDGRETRQVKILAPFVVESLLMLMSHGSLETLSARWCSALNDDDKHRLEEMASYKNCEIFFL